MVVGVRAVVRSELSHAKRTPRARAMKVEGGRVGLFSGNGTLERTKQSNQGCKRDSAVMFWGRGGLFTATTENEECVRFDDVCAELAVGRKCNDDF